MFFSKSVRLLAAPIILVLAVAGCAPRPASEEGGDDGIVGSQSPDSLSEANPTLQPPREDPGLGDAFPFLSSPPGKLTEEEMKRILAEKSPEESTLIKLRHFGFALLHFRDVYGRYPTDEEGLEIFLDLPPTDDGKTRGPIAQEFLLTDAWDRPILYRQVDWEDDLPGFEILSLGPDGVESEDDIHPDTMELLKQTASMIEAGVLEQMRAQREEE